MARKSLGLIVAISATIVLSQQPIFAQSMPVVTDGYFWTGKTAFARSSGFTCGFANRGHYEIYRRLRPAKDETQDDPSSFKYLGTCPLPQAIFYDAKKTGYYSFGDGKICGFSNPQMRNTYIRRLPLST